MPEPMTPVRFDFAQFADIVVVVFAAEAMRVMHKFVMRRIDAVLDRTLVITLDLVMDQRGSPAFLALLRHRQYRRTLRFGQVAEERQK